MAASSHLRRILCSRYIGKASFSQLLAELAAEGIKIVRHRFGTIESNIVVECDFDEEKKLQEYKYIRNTASLKGRGIASSHDKESVYSQLISSGHIIDQNGIYDFGEIVAFFFDVPNDSLDIARKITDLHYVGWDEAVHAIPC